MINQIIIAILTTGTILIGILCVHEFVKRIPNAKFMSQRECDDFQFLVWKMLCARYELEQAKTQHDRYYAGLRYSTAEHALRVFEREVVG